MRIIMTGGIGKAVGAGVAAGALSLALTAGAHALDSSQDAHKQAGTHQFYVWCTGADDFTMTHDGENGRVAQIEVLGKLNDEGRTTCWPVWQGKVN